MLSLVGKILGQTLFKNKFVHCCTIRNIKAFTEGLEKHFVEAIVTK